MGLDGTIKNPNGGPLGKIKAVRKAICCAFPGTTFSMAPSGKEKMRAASKRGIEFPEILRRHFETQPAQFVGVFEDEEFSVEFFLGAEEPVREVDVSVRGKTTKSNPMFRKLWELTGWETTHP